MLLLYCISSTPATASHWQREIFKTVHNISLSLTAYSGPLGRLFLAATLLILQSAPWPINERVAARLKAAVVFFRAHTFPMVTGNMPCSHLSLLQIPFLSSMKSDISFYGTDNNSFTRRCPNFLQALGIDRSIIPRIAAPRILLPLFFGNL